MVIEFGERPSVSLDYNIIEMIDDETLSCSDCLVSNHQYMDYRHLDWDSWILAHRFEKGIIMKYSDSLANPKLFYARLEKYEYSHEDDFVEKDIFFELGISSPVIALYSVGAFPINSCRGNPRSNVAPHVSFYANKLFAKTLEKLVAPLEAGLTNKFIESPGGLILYANDLSVLQNIGELLYLNRSDFTGISDL